METPTTLREAVRFFGDPDNALNLVASLRWPDGVTCPYCEAKEPMFLKTRRIWKCRACRKQFSVKLGTIFEDSPLPLDKWLITMWLLANCKNGVSSYEIARDLKITQKSTWFMLHRIRRAMQSRSFRKLEGEIEVDESFIGAKARNMHLAKRRTKVSGTGGKDKVAVMGMVERGGEVRAIVVPDRRKPELQKQVRQHITAGSAIFTDALQSYTGLDAEYAHQIVDHAVEYARGNVHTNTLENFWSLLKRGLHDTYISVEPFHLFRYLDEQSFRYNNRGVTDAGRFMLVCGSISGRRLTWKELTGKAAVN